MSRQVGKNVVGVNIGIQSRYSAKVAGKTVDTTAATNDSTTRPTQGPPLVACEDIMSQAARAHSLRRNPSHNILYTQHNTRNARRFKRQGWQAKRLIVHAGVDSCAAHLVGSN